MKVKKISFLKYLKVLVMLGFGEKMKVLVILIASMYFDAFFGKRA